MYFVKRVLPILLVLILGYTLGYQDAYRGPASLGWKLGDLIDHMKPETVRVNRARNGEAIRTQQRDSVAGAPN